MNSVVIELLCASTLCIELDNLKLALAWLQKEKPWRPVMCADEFLRHHIPKSCFFHFVPTLPTKYNPVSHSQTCH